MQLLDYTIVGTFLVFTLLLGLQKGWRAWDIADYAIGGRNYSTISLTLTLFATMMGSGVTMGMVELACKMGLVIVFINSAYAISRFLIARYFADAFAGFPQALSIASVVGTVYGRGARILTAVLGILSISSLISLQFRGMGTWAQHLLGLNYGQGLILGAIFITFYSSFGGIKGVTYTDILQGILIIVGFPVICFFAVQSVGGLGPLFERTPIEKINPVLHPKFWNEYFPLFILSLIPKFSPQNVHRLLMAKDARQAKHSFYAMSIMEIVFYMMFGILGLVVCLRSPNIPAKQAFCAIVTDLLPIGLRGLAVVAVLSVIMSTADSMINTTGVLFAHDIVNPLMEGRLNGRQQKVLASWASIGTGILGILFAWKINDIMAMKWLRKALWVPCLMVPIFCLLCGYRTSKKRFYAAAIAGLSGYALWEFFVKPYANTNGILPSMIVNALVLLDVPAILKRRKVKQQFEDRIKGGELVEVGQKASFFQRLARQCEYRTQIFGAPYLAFGLFMALVYVIPIFMWSPSCCHFRTAIMLHIISLVVIAFLVLKPYWPKELKPYWSLCWYGTLMFSLPTIATFYLLDTSDIVHSGFDFILSSCFLLALLYWKDALKVGVGGVFMGWILHRTINHMWPGFVSYRFESDGICSLLYIGFLTLAGYVLFIDRKEMAATRRVEQIKDIHSKDLADIMNALCTAALESDNEKEPCLNGREPTEPTGTSPSGEELRQKFEQKRQAFRYATVLLEYTLANLKDPTKSRWDMRKLSAKTFVLNAIDQYSLVENDRRRLEIRTLDPDFHFLGNSDLLDAVLYNVLRNALRGIRKKSGGRVGIYFESCGEEAGIIIEDNGIGIDPVNIPYMFDPYDSTYRGGSFCKQAMLSMRGDIRCYSLPNEVTRLVLLFKVFS